jgi:hypothetical protein
MFLYDDFNQVKQNGIIGAAHILPCEAMKRYIPKLEDTIFHDKRTILKQERLIYYCAVYDLEV